VPSTTARRSPGATVAIVPSLGHDPSTASLPLRMIQKSLLLVLVLVPALCAQAPATTGKPTVPPDALGSIQQQDLLAHATWLAAEERGGRLTGSPGQQAAADYIAGHFGKLGLEPLGDELGPDTKTAGKRGFEQRYPIARTFVDAASELRLGSLVLRDGFSIVGGKPFDLDFDGTLRFVGLGRTSGTLADVAADESLEGHVPVVVIKPKRGTIDRQLPVEQKFMNSLQTLGVLGKTASNLHKRGARAVLFVQLEDQLGLSDVLNYLAIAPGNDSLAAQFSGADPGMAAVSSLLAGGGEGGAPSIVMSLPASGKLLAELGVAPEDVVGFLAGEKERPVGKADVAVKVKVAVRRDAEAGACNVVAVLRGSDPALAHEAVVFSAHMDHVGKRMDGAIFHGADDNASGSAGLLAIAKAFATSESKPRRSVIFLAVSGEELGLWGSAWFAEHPTWKLADLVADINTDMIGRSGPESGPMEILVTPSHAHAMFSTLVQDAAQWAEQAGITFSSGDKYYMRSDHYNFAKKDIPVVFFCNGEHEDYHQVTDTADKLDGAKMERIARLAFATGWLTANAAERPRQLGRQPDWK